MYNRCFQPIIEGREKLNTQFCFEHSILADPYINRRELCAVLLEIKYILDFRIKKICSIFFSFQGVIEV